MAVMRHLSAPGGERRPLANSDVGSSVAPWPVSVEEHVVERRLAQHQRRRFEVRAVEEAHRLEHRSASAPSVDVERDQLCRRPRRHADPREQRGRAARRRRRACRPRSPWRRAGPSAASAVPSAITLPWSMTTMLSARRSASSRYCVVSSTVVPPLTSSSITPHSSLRPCGSSPVVGSSRNSTGGRCTSAAARSSRRRIPPEYVRDGPVGGVGEVELLEQLGRRAADLGRRQVRELARPARGSRGR